MRLFACLLPLIPALAGLAVRPLTSRLERRRDARLLTRAAVTLTGCSTVALALLAAAAAADMLRDGHHESGLACR